MKPHKSPCIPIILFLLIALTQGYAQQQHELSAYVSGVFATLRYDVHQGFNSSADNAGVGVAYAYALNPHWNLGLGAELQSYNNRTIIDGLSDNYATTDIEGDDFQFNYSAQRYEERQYVHYLNIPLTVSYQTKGDYTRFYASAGVQLGIAVQQEYSTLARGLQTSGYYPQWNTVLEAPGFMGFGEFGDQDKGRQSLELNNSYSLIAEAGIKQLLNPKNAIYLGAFITYGINNINKDNDEIRRSESNPIRIRVQKPPKDGDELPQEEQYRWGRPEKAR